MHDTKNTDDKVGKVNTLLNKQIVQIRNSQTKEDEKQLREDGSRNITRAIDLPNQEVFGSLVSLNDYNSNLNRDQ